MKRHFIFGFLAILFFTRITFAQNATNHPVRLVIIGDSTVCNYPTNRPQRGWGMFIQNYFDSNQLQVINLALPGRSTKTFIKEGHWAEALKEKPDYVLIQFGHNDSHASTNAEATDADTTFREYLRQYLDEANAINARPILITPMCRRIFQTNGLINNQLLPYADAMKQVAKEKKAPLVDLNASSVELCNRLGQKAADEMASAPTDQTHFNEKGAKEMARLVMQELMVAEPSLKQYESKH